LATLVLDRVSKKYRIGRGLTNLRELLSIHNHNKSSEFHWAVKDVSFKLSQGESLGIIGPNGAGKTTILKLLSQVTKPTSGEIQIQGRFSALIELGAGFHPDLTGRDNIFLNGTILGLTKSEIKRRFDEIIEFASIGTYLDTPVKRYSSGMYARLGFAIAAHVNPDVLLVDEVLAVGDFAFQQKCFARMEELRRNGTTLIFVSHNMDSIRKICDKSLVMYAGESIFQGTSSEAIAAYSNAIRQASRKSIIDVPAEGGLSQRVMTFDAEIESIQLFNEKREPTTVLSTGSNAILSMNISINKDIKNPIFAFFIHNSDGILIYNTTTQWMKINTPELFSGEKYQVEFKINLPLLEGIYELGGDIASRDLHHYYDRIEKAFNFTITGANEAKGLVDLQPKFYLNKSLLNI
jgi:lipopolysaccharide transport system ATP-binding protein